MAVMFSRSVTLIIPAISSFSVGLLLPIQRSSVGDVESADPVAAHKRAQVDVLRRDGYRIARTRP